MAKNLKEEFQKILKLEDHIADAITNFCGKMSFVYIHITWFGVWVLINVGLFAFVDKFDPFPFGLLTLIVSLEAIFLSTFVMISQNRTAKQADLRAQLDYETDLKAEGEIEQITILLQEIHQALGLNKNATAGVLAPSEGEQSAQTGAHAQLQTLIQARRDLETKMGVEAAKVSDHFE
jgi:uncharacterized membrane protein